MPTYRLDLAYDGTDLFGWQTQLNRRTVQEDLEKALGTILREPVRIIGAGRTDAGVHAIGQVASFRTQQEIPDEKRVLHSLNGILNRDIAVRQLSRAPNDFHARHSARYRQYAYSILLQKPALRRQYSWFLRYSVNWTCIEELLPVLTGPHDFRAFCSSDSATKDTHCDIAFFSLEHKGFEKVFHVRANRFLYRMVRSLVGTLIDIGRGDLPIENLSKALESGDRTLVGDTAPARGLTMVEVGY